jgi:hypothetical protein
VRVTYAQLDADTSKHALHTFTAARSFWPGNKSSGFHAPQHDKQNIFVFLLLLNLAAHSSAPILVIQTSHTALECLIT